MIKEKLVPGQIWEHDFAFTQAQVNDFAQATGDTNPVHLDPEFAAKTAFKSPVVHGMLGASVFSRVFGTIKPGPGTLYLNQSLEFLHPIRVEVPYKAVFTVLEEVAKKRFRIRTQLINQLDSGIAIDGEATIRVSA
jgi:acyl dehydratase